MNSLVFDPIVPAPLVLLLALVLGGLTIWVYRLTTSRLSPLRQFVLLAFRLAGLALVLLILLQPSCLETLPSSTQEKLTLVALDSSRSMRQTDAGKATRFDAARALVWDSGLAARGNRPAPAEVRLFTFADNATPVTTSLNELSASGDTTHFNESIQTMLGSIGAGQGVNALFLLTDGHDFELVNPAQTALAARARSVRIFAVPFGGTGNVRDLSVRITSFQPVNYAKQTIRLTAAIRQLGCPYETLNVSLLREGQVVQRKTVIVKEEPSVPLAFDVTEPAAGQFEYEVRVDPLPDEVDANNNSATSYVNVIDKKIRVLVLEGQPYWDTTFLQRSLRRDEKLDLDAVVSYAQNRLRVIRSEEGTGDFSMPVTPADWNRYDVVMLGKAVDTMLAPAQIAALQDWVEKRGGALVFSRGEAFSNNAGAAMQPVTWSSNAAQPAPLQVSREGRGIAPFEVVAKAIAASGPLPEMIGFAGATDRKPLAATVAEGSADAPFPAMIHRRFGAGQVLSIGVDGLWRWAFNAKAEGGETVFDRFWDQMVLWLVSGRDTIAGSRFTFRADTANVLLGEKIHFRIAQNTADRALGNVPVTIREGAREITRLTGVSPEGEPQRATADFVPQQPGRYVAEAQLPDGSRSTVRFITYTDNTEETEVAADPGYLRRLCEATGGRVIRPDELAGMIKTVRATPLEDSARSRKVAVWDQALIFWLIAALFAGDWYFRRKWGAT